MKRLIKNITQLREISKKKTTDEEYEDIMLKAFKKIANKSKLTERNAKTISMDITKKFIED